MEIGINISTEEYEELVEKIKTEIKEELKTELTETRIKEYLAADHFSITELMQAFDLYHKINDIREKPWKSLSKNERIMTVIYEYIYEKY